MRPLVLLLPFLLAGCTSLRPAEAEDEVAGCREVFEAVYLSVVDRNGEPAPGATVSATNLRTGEVYGPCPADDTATGTVLPAGCQADPSIGLFDPPDLAYYKIVDDRHREGLSARGDTLLIRGTRGDRSFETRQVIRDDGCHVEKTWGLDEVRLR
jgi:hypothetical protein